ncbi:hypothetical protein ACWOC1_06035 [Enterococcus quebecensis]|uniref:Uncharacterized protein n=1 Tax=Enterococcus quebecensis TaxID=903983 RepID=A0A1E5GW38_9ENTE|nr:hypothetical protein [Enterococcus quebecensis]OEG16520.1 hypothetical protein BCR23_06425 [Enterococcus quebecensis]
MRKIRPQNPIYLLFGLFIPWRFMNTYYVLKKDKLIISRYYVRKNTKYFDRKIDCLDLEKLVKFGLPKDIGSTRIEPTIHGLKGSYKSQEIQFLFEDGTIVAWNVRFYTKKQIKMLLELIYLRYGIMACEGLQEVLGIND